MNPTTKVEISNAAYEGSRRFRPIPDDFDEACLRPQWSWVQETSVKIFDHNNEEFPDDFDTVS